MDPKRESLDNGESNTWDRGMGPIKFQDGGFEGVRDVCLCRVGNTIMYVQFAKGPPYVIGDDEILASTAACVMDLQVHRRFNVWSLELGGGNSPPPIIYPPQCVVWYQACRVHHLETGV